MAHPEEVVFETDGVRGRADFILGIAERVGRAVGSEFGEGGDGLICVGWDPRELSPVTADAVIEGVRSLGVNVLKIGQLPTPALAYATDLSRANAGIMITASHNPASDNGIKVFGRGGDKLDDAAEIRLGQAANRSIADSVMRGNVVDGSQYREKYIDFLVSQADGPNSLEGLDVVIDMANGATSGFASAAFRRLGARVTPMFDKPDGLNINQNCGATHTDALQEAVISGGHELGIALDGDGDRVYLVNALGESMNGDHTLYINAATENLTGAVGTVMANLGMENGLRDRGIELFRSDVGDRYVLEMLREKGLNLGGEQSGHTILYDRLRTGDGTLAAIVTLGNVKKSGKSLEEWSRMWEPYPQTLINVPVLDKHASMERLSVLEVKARVEKALGNLGRVLLRASGTQPMVRVMVEAKSDVAEQYAQEIADAVAA